MIGIGLFGLSRKDKEWIIAQLNTMRNNIIMEVEFIMDATAQKLSDDLTALQTAFTTGLKDMADEIAGLKAQIAAGETITDEDLTSLDKKVTDMTAAVTGADPGPQG